MAKTRVDRRAAHKLAGKKARRSRSGATTYDPDLASSLLESAQASLATNDLPSALSAAQKTLQHLNPPNTQTPSLEQLPALEVLGVIYLELGDSDSARKHFELAARVDSDGEYAGAEKFLWLAQLSEEGGSDTIRWFEKGIHCLRSQSLRVAQAAPETTSDSTLSDNQESRPEYEEELQSLNNKLANALCSAAEVYMTDLSFEDDCEEKCEALAQEAIELAPDNPVVLQTLANIRISQERTDEARQLLKKSMSLWQEDESKEVVESVSDQNSRSEDEEDSDNDTSTLPDFASRISLCRMLMEVDMCAQAMQVLERLVEEDDSSVETWYLGGWCQHLLNSDGSSSVEDRMVALEGCQRWLQMCLQEYNKQRYEDERLKDHAITLIDEIEHQVAAANIAVNVEE